LLEAELNQKLSLPHSSQPLLPEQFKYRTGSSDLKLS
jgi:hypothetical protein